MKTIRNFLAAAALIIFGSGAAFAQSACPYIATGAVLTAAQWNQCFANKNDALGYVPVNRAGDVMLGKLTMAASSSTSAGLNIPQGSAPASPINGDVWTTLSGMFVRINGATIGPLASASAGTYAATAPLAVTFPSGVVTYALATDANFSVVASQLALASGGVAYPSSVTGGAKGAGTINASGLYVNGTAVTAAGITALTGDVTATGPGSAAATLATAQGGVHTWAATQTFTVAPVFTDQSGSRTALGLGTAAVQNTGTSGANVPLLNGANTWGATQTFPSPAFTGTVSGANTIPLGVIEQSAANTMLGNWTGSTANVAANAMPSCPDTGGNHLNYVSGTGITCGTGLGSAITALTGDVTASGPGSAVATLATVNTNVGSFGGASSVPNFTVNGKGLITAAGSATVVAPAGTLTGTTLNATVVTSSLTSVGALAGGSATTGFTINAANVTWSGQVPGASVAPVGDASGSASATFGVIKCDGLTITCASGVATAVGGSATSITIGTTTIVSGTTGRVLYDNAGVIGEKTVTGTGDVVLATSPTLVTPVLGVASATSVNKVALTAPATGSTLTISDGKTLTANNSITLAGTDSTTMTFPGSSASIAALNLTGQVISGGATVTSQSISAGNYTVDCGSRPLQYITGHTSSWTITAPAADGSCILLLTNPGSSVNIPSFSGFTVNAAAGGALTATASAKFYISVWRINGTAGYLAVAAQ